MRNHFSRDRKTKHGKIQKSEKSPTKKESEKTEILMEKRRQKKRVLQKFKKILFFFLHRV